MARRSKPDLIQLVINAFLGSGWAVERLSDAQTHPARLTVTRRGVRRVLTVYIWNMSHGGRGRADYEHRIQITGHAVLEAGADGPTLILGWEDDLKVFAGFDPVRRLGEVGNSPSIQIRRQALDAALRQGGAVQAKRDGEFAAAIRPDRLDVYAETLEAVHAGDASSLTEVQYSTAVEPLESLNALASPGAVFDFGRPDADALKDEVLNRSKDLLAALDANPVQPGQIGHNGPPGPINDDESPVRLALKDIIDEAANPKPDGHKLARAGGFLEWVRSGLKTALKEGGKLVEKGKDLAREHAITILVSAVAGGAKHIPELLGALIDVLLKWLQLAAGLF
jgi:hypothetical protein